MNNEKFNKMVQEDLGEFFHQSNLESVAQALRVLVEDYNIKIRNARYIVSEIGNAIKNEYGE